jgi:hypothetical protein
MYPTPKLLDVTFSLRTTPHCFVERLLVHAFEQLFLPIVRALYRENTAGITY